MKWFWEFDVDWSWWELCLGFYGYGYERGVNIGLGPINLTFGRKRA